MADLLPLFLNLNGRDVVLVGGGPVATAKLRTLLAAGARVRLVAPEVTKEIVAMAATAAVEIVRRVFLPEDLDGAWLAVAAATPEANRGVAAAAEVRRVFVNAADDPANASAFLTGTIRRDGVTLAISTEGDAPALTALVREALDALLPADLHAWVAAAKAERVRWRRERVPMAARKPRLLVALNRIYDAAQGSGLTAHGAAGFSGSSPEPEAGSPRPRAASPPASARGFVSLVGAGPGDPALLTRKAVARLRAADLVLYDALIDDRALGLARKAQRFFAGKRAGRHAMSQETIHRVMIRAAQRGRRVVRLQGGDPMVFGRGGEELLALERAGIPVEVVPGVTNAIAAPALAGIPVTHRGRASAFFVVSGHDAVSFARQVAAVQPGSATLVVLMGVGRAQALAAALVERGWPGATPAAIVFQASTVDQRTWLGTLDSLTSGLGEGGHATGGPGTIVIGEVVALARQQAAPIERVYVTGR